MEYNIKNILSTPQPLGEKKNYLVTELNKMNCDKEKDLIIRMIKQQFESVDNFFKIDEKIIIGKKLFYSSQNPKFHLHNDNNERKQNLRTNTIKLIKNNPPNSTSILHNNNKKRTIRLPTNFLKEKTKIPINFTEDQKDFDILNVNQLKKIFDEAKVRCEKSKDKLKESLDDNKMMKSLDKRNLHKQEKILEHNKRINLRSANISKKISNQIDNDETDLLMNRVCDFRMKKQIKEILDDRTPFIEKFGEKGWILNLRREKNQKIVRFNYVNIGSNHKPIFEQLNEYPIKNVEILNTPIVNFKKDLKKFFKNNYLKDACEKLKLDLERIKGTNKIEIDAKNILVEEIKKYTESKFAKKISRITYGDEEVKDEIFKEYYHTNPNKATFPKCLVKLQKEKKMERDK